MYILLGICCFVSAVLIAVLVVFATWTGFSRLGMAKLDLIRSGNTAAAVVLGTELLAFAVLMRSCFYPISAVLQDMLIPSGADIEVYQTIGYIAGYFLLGYALSVLTIFIASRLFQRLTRRMDEKAEVENGNMAVALVYGLVIIAVAVMVQSGLGDLLNTLIPPPGNTAVSLAD